MISGVSSIDIPKSSKKSRGAPAWLLARLQAEEELRFWPQPWRSVSEFLAEYGLWNYKKSNWRLTAYVLGQINGIPASKGRLAATNGILCLIVTESRKLFEGHLEWFEPMEKLEERVAANRKTEKVLKELEGL